MANIPEVTDQTFQDEVLQSDQPVVVDFWAPWCGPCRAIAPILDQMATEHAGRVKFVKLNVDDNPETASRYNVLSIPTVMLFDGGDAQDSVVGARAKGHYESSWERWLAPVS
jgi:thioredoxin 1